MLTFEHLPLETARAQLRSGEQGCRTRRSEEQSKDARCFQVNWHKGRLGPRQHKEKIWKVHSWLDRFGLKLPCLATKD